MAESEQSHAKHLMYTSQHGLTGNGLQELVNELTNRLSTFHHSQEDDSDINAEETEEREDLGRGQNPDAGFAQNRNDSSTMKESKTFPFGIKTFADDSSISGE